MLDDIFLELGIGVLVILSVGFLLTVYEYRHYVIRSSKKKSKKKKG